MLMRSLWIPVLGGTVLAAAVYAPSAGAVVVLASDLTGVDTSDTTAPFTATGITWDTVAGVVAPLGELTFVDPGGGGVDGFFSATDEISVDYNMSGDGPWSTSIELALDGATSSLGLTSIDVDLRLTNNSGANNSTGSKNGKTTIELIGSTSGSLGLVDPGNSGYPSVEYTRSIDLTSLPALDGSETYTLVLTTSGSGFGHNKSLQGLTLNGDISGGGVPADLSGDGDVDDEDLGLFFSAFTGPDNGPSPNPAADLSGDGDVDDEDLGQAFSAFTGPLGPTSVPEPSSVLLIGAAGMLVVRRRRRG